MGGLGFMQIHTVEAGTESLVQGLATATETSHVGGTG